MSRKPKNKRNFSAIKSKAYETNQYGLEDLPGLLGALDYVCTECTKNVS